MAKNLKTFEQSTLDYLNNNFNVIYVDSIKSFIVSKVNYSRKVLHDYGKSFTLNTPCQKVTISPQMQEYYVNYYLNSNYTIFDVKNAVSTLIITYQEVTKEKIDEQLKRNGSKIKVA